MKKTKDNITLDEEETKTIPYPEKYANNLHQDGASAFGGMTDHNWSKYYVANDFYNMKSDGTLHILNRFETYQQTMKVSVYDGEAQNITFAEGETKTITFER